MFHCIYSHSFFIHLSVDGHLCFFHIMAIVNSAAMNLGCMYLSELVFLFFSQIYIQEWNCWIIWQFYFYFLMNLHTVFHSGCTNLHSTNSVKGFPFSTSSPTFLCVFFFMIAQSDRCEVISHCCLTCLSLIISNVEHLFMCLLAICMSSLQNCPYPLSIFNEIFLL